MTSPDAVTISTASQRNARLEQLAHRMAAEADAGTVHQPSPFTTTSWTRASRSAAGFVSHLCPVAKVIGGILRFAPLAGQDS